MADRTVGSRRQRSVFPKVGVRELRQNLSIHLARVIAGERLEVTDRGVPVALLVPLPPKATLVERLVAAGRAVPARRRLDELPALKGRLPGDLDSRLQQALRESREDEA